jgi:hypothetical protein
MSGAQKSTWEGLLNILLGALRRLLAHAQLKLDRHPLQKYLYNTT